MNSKDLERLLARLSGWTKSEIDQRVRPLRESGALDRGAGRHAPDLNAVQAATVLLQLVARRASDAKEVTREIFKLRAVAPPEASETLQLLLNDAGRLPEVMAWGMASDIIKSVRLACDGSFCWLSLVLEGETYSLWFTASEAARQWVADYPDTYYAQGETYVGHCFYAGSGALAEIAMALKERPKGGWAGEQAA